MQLSFDAAELCVSADKKTKNTDSGGATPLGASFESVLKALPRSGPKAEDILGVKSGDSEMSEPESAGADAPAEETDPQETQQPESRMSDDERRADKLPDLDGGVSRDSDLLHISTASDVPVSGQDRITQHTVPLSDASGVAATQATGADMSFSPAPVSVQALALATQPTPETSFPLAVSSPKGPSSTLVEYFSKDIAQPLHNVTPQAPAPRPTTEQPRPIMSQEIADSPVMAVQEQGRSEGAPEPNLLIPRLGHIQPDAVSVEQQRHTQSLATPAQTENVALVGARPTPIPTDLQPQRPPLTQLEQPTGSTPVLATSAAHIPAAASTTREAPFVQAAQSFTAPNGEREARPAHPSPDVPGRVEPPDATDPSLSQPAPQRRFDLEPIAGISSPLDRGLVDAARAPTPTAETQRARPDAVIQPTMQPLVPTSFVPDARSTAPSIEEMTDIAPALSEPGQLQGATQTRAAIPHPPAIARQVVQQIADQALQAGDRLEITLSPEELGRVRLSATQTDQGVVLLVQAERPETLDLMRRHMPELMQDLQDMGFGDISYSEQHQSDQHQRNEPSQTTTESTPEMPQQTLPTSGLDLRL